MSKKTKILIVDDNENDLILMEALLRMNGYEVVSAENGVDAFKKLRNNSVNMIVSDILMPEMDGFQFCRECKMDDSLKRIPFVFYSATYKDKKDEEFALSLGAEKFLLKPLEPEVLMNTLKSLIEEHKNAVSVTLKTPEDDEKVYLTKFNKRLVMQLERKVLDLEKEIDERRQSENALKKSEEKYHNLFHNAYDAIFVADVETGIILEANKSAEKLIGMPAEEIVGMHQSQLHPREELEHYKRIFEKHARSGAAEEEGFVMHKDGYKIPVYISASVVEYGGKKVIMGMFRDMAECTEELTNKNIELRNEITERERIEDELRKSEEKFSLLLKSSGEAVYGLDLEGNCSFCNPSCLRVLGYEDESQLLDRNMHDLIHHTREDGTHYPVEECCIYQAFRKGEGTCVDNEVLWRADGTSFAAEYRSSPIFREGKTIGAVVSFIDITERKLREEELKRSLKEKETLLMEIHHRVRNNLQVISSLLLLHTKYLKDEQSNKVFKDAQNRICSMAAVHEILYDAKLLSDVDFSLYVRTLADRLYRSYGINPDKISLKIITSDVVLAIDQAVPLGLLVNELLSNALEHAFPSDKIGVEYLNSDQSKQEEYEICISLTPTQDNRISLTVSDNGVGIPEDLDFRTTDSLGLTLVNILAETQLNGELALDRSVKGAKIQIIF